jgi:hypothetical protein
MLSNNLNMNGHVKIVTTNKQTGEIIDVYEEDNLVVSIGLDQILKSITVKDTNNYIIETISIGDDVGSGTVMQPEQPSLSYTKTNQTVVFTAPPDLIIP